MPIQAFAPGQVTGFFQVFEKGSTGASINVGKGMHTEVQTSSLPQSTFYLNGNRQPLPVSATVLHKILDRCPSPSSVEVRHTAELPVGFGTGMSAAGALSLSLALNEHFQLHLSYAECVQIAFEAEVENSTGLNGVKVLQYPGLLIGNSPDSSHPPPKIPIQDPYLILAFLNPLDTQSIIRGKEWVQKINEAGQKALDALRQKPTPETFMACSRAFAFETGLASQEVAAIMEQVKKCSMAMLGQTVFAFSRDPEKEALMFAPYSQDIRICPLQHTGPRLVKGDA